MSWTDGASASSSACGYIRIAESTDAVPGLLIVSVYRPDVYEDALRSIGVARDLLIVLDRRVGDRRQHVRTTKPSRRLDRRRIDIAEQLRTSGWAYVSPHELETLSAFTAPHDEAIPDHT
jgi:hypothetical protein